MRPTKYYTIYIIVRHEYCAHKTLRDTEAWSGNSLGPHMDFSRNHTEGHFIPHVNICLPSSDRIYKTQLSQLNRCNSTNVIKCSIWF